MMSERTITWVSWRDLRGYARLHKIEAPEGETIGALYASGRLPERTKCGTKVPDSVADITERTRTLRCRKCFPSG